MQRIIKTLLAIMIIAPLLSACGETGPLFLPSESASNSQSLEQQPYNAQPMQQNQQDQQQSQPQQAVSQTPQNRHTGVSTKPQDY